MAATIHRRDVCVNPKLTISFVEVRRAPQSASAQREVRVVNRRTQDSNEPTEDSPARVDELSGINLRAGSISRRFIPLSARHLVIGIPKDRHRTGRRRIFLRVLYIRHNLVDIARSSLEQQPSFDDSASPPFAISGQRPAKASDENSSC